MSTRFHNSPLFCAHCSVEMSTWTFQKRFWNKIRQFHQDRRTTMKNNSKQKGENRVRISGYFPVWPELIRQRIKSRRNTGDWIEENWLRLFLWKVQNLNSLNKQQTIWRREVWHLFRSVRVPAGITGSNQRAVPNLLQTVEAEVGAGGWGLWLWLWELGSLILWLHFKIQQQKQENNPQKLGN